MSSNALHTGVVGTTLNGTVNLRTVVLRRVEPDAKQLIFYTDARSAKMTDLEVNAGISWLFYDGADKVQIRLSGTAIIHNRDEVAAYYWDKVKPAGRRSYQAIPGPSTSVTEATDGLEHLNKNSHPDGGYDNFTVVITQVDVLEWLCLNDTGHRRAQFRLLDGSWKGQWLIP